MTTVTHVDYAGMSWHQRQTLNDRLRAETTQLRAQAHRVGAIIDAHIAALDAEREANYVEARDILEYLPVDPDAAKHRLELDQDLANHWRSCTGRRTGDWK